MEPKQKTNTIKTGVQYRSLMFDKRSIDEEARTVDVAFSSEEPVERWFGQEILDHAGGSVRLGRLQNAGPVLMDHDTRDQVGVIESATIDGDRKGRALVRFGKSPRAEVAFNDVIDGIRKHISVGYRIHKMTLEDPSADLEVYRATDWEPYEVSFVSVPADISVGVGRSTEKQFTTEVIRMDPLTDPATNADPVRTSAPAPAPVVDVSAAVEKATRTEMDRIDTIRKIGEKYECEDLARSFINDKKSVDEMTRAVLENVGQRQAETGPVTELGMGSREVQNYSMLKAVRASLSGNWKDAGLEQEASIAIADSLGREARGFFVPFEVQQRVMTVGADSAGGYAVGTDHLAGSFIDRLRAEALLGRLGATFLEGLEGNVDIPRLDTGATWGWLAEDADATAADGVLGQVLLSPKTIGGAVPISRRLLKQSSPSIEQMLMNDMAAGAALAIDLAGFQGSGAAGQPTGIVSTSGVGASTIAAAGTPTHVELVEFETDVAEANGLSGSLAYVTTAGVRGTMKTTALDAGSGQFLMQNGEANGYNVEVSTQLAANRIIFGNFQQVIIGMWGVLDVMPDEATKAASGGLVLRAFQDVDIGIRHAGAFSINA